MTEDLERRHFHRIGAQYADRKHVLLRVRGKDIAAELVDQSLEGFSVLVPRSKVRLAIGKRVLLGTRATWHEVEVANLEKQKKDWRVGFRLVGDCLAPPESNLWVWLSLVATLALASVIIYQNEDPHVGSLHRCLHHLGIQLAR